MTYLIICLFSVLLLNFSSSKGMLIRSEDSEIELSSFTYYAEDGTVVGYEKLIALTNTVVVNVQTLDVENLMLDMDVEMKTITINGHVYVNSEYTPKNVSIIITNVVSKGLVSLAKDGNSYKPINSYLHYDYKIADVIVGGESSVPTWFSPDLFWFELENHLTNSINSKLPKIINKILRAGKSNEIIDDFLNEARYIDNSTSLEGSAITFTLKGVKITTDVGTITNLAHLKRLDTFTMVENEDTTFLYGYIYISSGYTYTYNNYTTLQGSWAEYNNRAIISADNQILIGMAFDHHNNCDANITARFVDISNIKTTYPTAQKPDLSKGMDPWMLGQLRLFRTSVEDWIVKLFKKVYKNEANKLPMC